MESAWKKWSVAALLAILVLAAFFRFYRITETPPGLYPDEAANGNNAVEALHTGEPKIFYPENNGREGLFINIQAISIKLFGPEPWALRLVSAFFGTLTVLGIYLLGKELFNAKLPIFNSQSTPNDSISKRFENWKPARPAGGLEIGNSGVALLSAFFLATSYWHINFSRIGFRAITVPFFATFGIYWLLKSIRTGKISSAVLGGVFTGLGFHTYIAFRLMPVVLPLPIGIGLWRWYKKGGTQSCTPCIVAIFLFVVFVTALPIGLYFLAHPADFSGRSGQVSVFSAASPLKELAKSTALTLGMFNIWGDCNQRHNLSCQPELFWPIGVFFLIGLAATLREALSQKSEARGVKSEVNSNDQSQKFKTRFDFRVSNLFRISDFEFRASAWTLLIWFGLMLLPAILTREGLPHALRTIGAIPPTMLLAGLGAFRLWEYLQSAFSRWMEDPRYRERAHQLWRIKRELAVVALLVLAWIPIQTYRDYFVRFAYGRATPDAFAADLWHEGKYLAALPKETKKFVIVNLAGDDIRGVPAPAQSIMFATDTFEDARAREKNFRYVTKVDEINFSPGETVVIIPMNPWDTKLSSELRSRFPTLDVKVPQDFVVFKN